MKQHLKRNAFFYLLILGLGGYCAFQYVRYNMTISEYQDAWEDKRQELSFYTKQAMDSSHVDVLKFGMKSLVWAMRSELLSENHEQIHRYMLDLEHEQQVSRVIICDANRKILFASQESWIGQELSVSGYAEHYLNETAIAVKTGNNGELILIAPIMGLNAQVGTLMLTYEHQLPEILKVVAPLKID